ncbi:hypothetical protein BDN70DRAFT_874136 [Pholiota conissans]|uniref:F-box domain-containing protein n=1 Tax=Pholiota conissans TaxID=109636 RepID=A0A9P5Z7M3_9AGAR|nr:hypothetical protein BDN70DRAFT_874136 [Pholiota conissans]
MHIFKKAPYVNLIIGSKSRSTIWTKGSTPSLADSSTSEYTWSPVPHLLASNMPPSEEEAIVIRSAISDVEERLLESKSIYVDSDNAHRFVEQHLAILSVIRRIPIEILQEIILFATVGQPIEKVKEFRWQISYVSQAWRIAAVTLPVLWAVLPTVRLTQHHAEHFKRTHFETDCLAEILRRSGNRPLTVTIEEDKRHRNFEYSALNLVAKHCERWETASISIPITALNALLCVRGRLPRLKILFLHLLIGMEYNADTSLDMFEIAPQLRRVHMVGSVPSHLKLPPKTQFTHYKHMFITQVHLNTVAQYSSLESLFISQKVYTITFPATTLPRLKKLEFVTVLPAQDDGSLGCFDNLRLPALEELSVVFPFYSPSILPSIIRMISNTGPSQKLHTLRIHPGTMAPGELMAMLGLTPALAVLDTVCPPHTDIENLASKVPTGQPKIAPCLRTCRFMFDAVVSTFLSDNTRDALNRLAQTRCEDILVPMELSVYSMSSDVHGVPWSRAKQMQIEDWAPILHVFKLNEMLRKISAKQFKKHVKLVEFLLNTIEGTRISSAKEVYVSGIHITLRRMLENEDILSSNAKFRQRVEGLLSKWDSLMLPALGDIHWCCQGPRMLTYISDEKALRASSDALDIVYGLKNEMSIDEACWTSQLGIFGITLTWPRRVGYFEVVG